MESMEEVFDFYINQFKSVDVAENEFKKAVADDSDLRMQYRDWCHETGNTEKGGFLAYVEEFISNQNDIWETLSDYDNAEM